MKILFSGDRYWDDEAPVRSVLEGLSRDTEIIQGGAPGLDRMVKTLAEGMGFKKVKTVYANWDYYGKAAGPIRNKDMVDQKPDLVLAFHNDLEHSKGTADLVKQARAAGLFVILFSNGQWHLGWI